MSGNLFAGPQLPASLSSQVHVGPYACVLMKPPKCDEGENLPHVRCFLCYVSCITGKLNPIYLYLANSPCVCGTHGAPFCNMYTVSHAVPDSTNLLWYGWLSRSDTPGHVQCVEALKVLERMGASHAAAEWKQRCAAIFQYSDALDGAKRITLDPYPDLADGGLMEAFGKLAF